MEDTKPVRKRLSERCTTWIRGRQCDNYRSSTGSKCALHAKPKA